jgi:HPt (histidine-containing phosphotransfer) domain-containing protein
VNDLPILDRERLSLITLGDAARAEDFLGALFLEGAELCQRLDALLPRGDRLAVSDTAHTLKGIAAELGAMRLRAVSATLEAERESKRWPDCVEQIRAALAELQAFTKP